MDDHAREPATQDMDDVQCRVNASCSEKRVAVVDMMVLLTTFARVTRILLL